MLRLINLLEHAKAIVGTKPDFPGSHLRFKGGYPLQRFPVTGFNTRLDKQLFFNSSAKQQAILGSDGQEMLSHQR